MPQPPLKYLITACFFLALIGCQEDQISQINAPELLVDSPLNFGNVPIGSQQTGKLVVSNGGDAPLVLDEVVLDSETVAFQVGMKELPLTVRARRAVEVTIIFTPFVEGAYRAELSFVSNHQGAELTPVVLIGNGLENVICLPCEPPPNPECSEDRNDSLSFVPNTDTDCESENGECGYTVIENPCEWGLCVLETGLCPGEPDSTAEAEPVCGDGEVNGDELCDDGNVTVETCPYGEGACEVCGENCVWVAGHIQFCGDGDHQEEIEECDNGTEGNSNELPDACRTNCLLPFCGDNVTDTNESCDDGNNFQEDGCSDVCLVEEGWDCTGPYCVPICGDGIVVGDEACDDGNTETELCAYGATYCVVCDSECQFSPGVLQTCGDGTVQEGEECDDGAANNNYAPNACRENCSLAGCGDGVIDLNEACDDANTNNDDGCSELCIVENGWTCVGQPSACDTLCGDNIIAGAEQCDDGNTIVDVCDYNVMSCEVCGSDCTLVNGLFMYCGDGVWQEGFEECDDGIEGLDDGQPTVFNSDTLADACRGNCVQPRCGDGVIDSGEFCDDLDTDDGDGCSSHCVVEDGWECHNEPSICDLIALGAPGESCEEAEPIYAAAGQTTALFGVIDDYNLPFVTPCNYDSDCDSPSESCTPQPQPIGSGWWPYIGICTSGGWVHCTGWPTDGPDVFYEVTLQPGEQFKARAEAHFDISIYLLRSCPAPEHGCIAGSDGNSYSPIETFAYTWPSTRSGPHTFYFGIDTYCNDQFDCPRAYCNDGNNIPGDGCDENNHAEDWFTLEWTITALSSAN